jgi:integrator complex subunit 11
MFDCGMHMGHNDARRWVGVCCCGAVVAQPPCAASSAASSAGSGTCCNRRLLSHPAPHPATRRFPDFSLLAPDGDYNSVVDAVFITHFHLDHVGALPFFTGVRGWLAVCGSVACAAVWQG